MPPLYKYVVADRIDVLRNELIRFTQPAALNDPFELQPYFNCLVSEQTIAEVQHVDLRPLLIEAYMKQSEDIKRQVPLDVFLNFMAHLLNSDQGAEALDSGFVMALEAMQHAVAILREQIGGTFTSRIGLLSLTEDPACMPMWAHYADNHRGMVICFDYRHSFFHGKRSESDEFFYIRRVVYEPVPESRVILDIDGQEILLRKEPSWSYEREWRVLAPVQYANQVLSSANEPIYLFSVPSSCVTGVILGARCSSDTEQAVRNLSLCDPRYRHLNINKAIIDQATLRMRIEPA